MADKHNPTKNLTPEIDVEVDLLKNIVLQSKEDKEELNSQVLSGKALVKKNYPFDLNDHLNSSYELKEEKKKLAEDKATKKKDKMEYGVKI